jgi:transcriptional regulator with XRE-family HTH domain/quercetin dioxygenase-like cupin family protein
MPVYGSHRLPYEDLAVGRRLRCARQCRGLTLRDLAKLTRLSPALLSQLETERRPLDVGQGLAIASALGLTVDDLLSDDSTIPYQVVRDDQLLTRKPRQVALLSPAAQHGVTPMQFYALADRFTGRHMEPLRGLVMPARSNRSVAFSFQHEQEFILVLRGTMELSLKTPTGTEQHQLGPGDSVYFWSNLPHCIRSLDAHAAETLQVFASAPGSLRKENSWLVAPHAEAESGTTDRLKSIGRKLKCCRVATEETLHHVAELIGVTPRQLDLAESGRRPLAMSAMVRFAQLFGYPLREFMGEATACPPYSIVQRASEVGTIPPVRRRSATSPTNIFRRLNRGLPSNLMMPCFIQIPTTDEVASPHEHHGEEFIYVLSGQLELTIGSGHAVRTESLRAGDSCYIDATVPHVLKGRPLNPYDRLSAEVIDLFWCPLGEDYLFETSDGPTSPSPEA